MIPFSLFSQTVNSTSWAEKQLQKMSLEEKIAQLMVIRIHSNQDENYNLKKIEEIKQYQPGGVCFFQGGPAREIALTNRIQAVSKVPLLISMDAEWGPSMRLDSMPVFPRNMTLGALAPQYDNLIYQMGKQIGLELRTLGIHVNYAPVVDVNNNSKNPVINSRSFGEQKNRVVVKGLAYMQGLRDGGAVPCAKHFPGHGDTDVDSHLGLPTILKSRKELDETELYPFREMINQNVEMIMVSHLNIPALDDSENSIASLSYPIVTDLLKKEMHFKGIVISDGMEMDGIRKYHKEGAEAEILCLKAGVDQLCLPADLSIVIPEIAKAVREGIISEKEINEKCLKILQLKERLGLTHYTPLSTQVEHLVNNKEADDLIKEIETKALTLLTNQGIIPLIDKTETALLIVGDTQTIPYSKKVAEEQNLPYIELNREFKPKEADQVLQFLSNYQEVIVLYSNTNQSPARQYGITEQAVQLFEKLSKSKKVVLALFGNPYGLEQFKKVDHFEAVIIGYQRTENSIRGAVQGILGELPFEGLLPVSTLHFKSGENFYSQTASKENLSRISSVNAALIDSIVIDGIQRNIYPGCQVMVVKSGETVFKKNYGTLDGDPAHPVEENTLYDIASITKIASTTLAVMKLYEEGKIKLRHHVEEYLPFYEDTPVGKIRIDELLTHTSGLPAYIPFHQLLKSDSMRYLYLNDISNERFNVPVANNLFVSSEFQQLIRNEIKNCKLNKQRYVYSDLGFILLCDIIEKISGVSLDGYVKKHFYIPLGMHNTCYNPLLQGVYEQRIAPTENDTLFRMQLVRGYVHDQNCALMGGVCGHAGIFSTTEDLAILFQMLQQGGKYNGKTYFKKSTVEHFTSPYEIHRSSIRGLGFYTPGAVEKSSILPTQAGAQTYGHQGFTGTVIWSDPDAELIYIFLSNRVYPNAEPNLLSQSKIRLILHEKFYDFLTQ